MKIRGAPNPVVTAPSLAGFAVFVLAFPFDGRFWGFGLGGVGADRPVLLRPTRWSPLHRWPVLPAVAVPALRSRPLSDTYAPAVSRRTPVSCSMRRKGHRSRPRAMTCSFFSLRSRRRSYRRRRLPCVGVNVPEPHFRWPVLS